MVLLFDCLYVGEMADVVSSVLRCFSLWLVAVPAAVGGWWRGGGSIGNEYYLPVLLLSLFL